jgi:uncharacterized membrane protein YeiH
MYHILHMLKFFTSVYSLVPTTPTIPSNILSLHITLLVNDALCLSLYTQIGALMARGANMSYHLLGFLTHSLFEICQVIVTWFVPVCLPCCVLCQ